MSSLLFILENFTCVLPSLLEIKSSYLIILSMSLSTESLSDLDSRIMVKEYSVNILDTHMLGSAHKENVGFHF